MMSAIVRADQTSGPPRGGAPDAAAAAIRGRVIAVENGQPIRKAQVQLSSEENARGGRFENQVTTTDTQGKFEFDKLPAGRYHLTASKGGYVSLAYGQRRPFESGKPIELVADQILERVDFALPRAGVLTGRVLDEFGEPTSNIQVVAMRYQFDRKGRRRLAPVGNATTNDLGEFRIFGLVPGDYFLSAMFAGEFGDSRDRTAYAPIFYPGTTDPDLAERLVLTSGQTLSDLVLTLVPVRTVRVTGTAVDADGRPLPGFLIAEPSGSRVEGAGMHATLVQRDGSFRIGGLTAGQYRLLVRGVPILGSSEPITASAELTVGTDDVTDVRIVAGKRVAVTGKVVITDARAARALQPSTLRVIGIADDEMSERMSDINAEPRVNDDWTFQITLPPGRSRLHLIGMPPGWDVKAVRSRDVDVTDVGLDVKPTEDLGNIEIELTNRVTETSGIVTDKGGDPVKDYVVVIFPRDREKRGPESRSVRTARPDQDGAFKIVGLPSGEYFAYALDFIEPGEERDPEFLERIQTIATQFALGEGEIRTLRLELHER
jgi:5-hydroxyisourate hydrolase-like protein (transthyretin family)